MVIDVSHSQVYSVHDTPKIIKEIHLHIFKIQRNAEFHEWERKMFEFDYNNIFLVVFMI